MRNEIIDDNNDDYERFSNFSTDDILEYLIKLNNSFELTSFIKYITDIDNFIIYEREIMYNNHPFISLSILILNICNCIEKNL